MSVCPCVIFAVQIYMCIFTVVVSPCMYVCMYVCTYVCMYVHMYACMYVCAYVCVSLSLRVYQGAKDLDVKPILVTNSFYSKRTHSIVREHIL